ncbi:helix-turn-helix domain-containing protein, partial [Acinetobacter variabilis]
LLEQERIKRCESLLHQPLSLTEIAQQLDYSDQSALARAYKAATGRTLLQYRKQLKQDQA